MSSETNKKPLIGAVIALLAIAGAAVWYDQSRTAVVPNQTAAATPTPVVGVEDVQTAADETSANSAARSAPAFDTFFRNPDDTTVIAGRAAAGDTVAIMLSGVELERVVAAADGTFGTVVFIAAADQPRRLQLIADPDGVALTSEESILVPPSAPVAVADVAAEPEAVVTDEQSTVAVTSDTVQADAPVAIATPTLLPQEPALPSAAPTLIADADGVRVIQPAPTAAIAPELAGNIALDTITYDPAGEVVLSGRAEAGGTVQVYLNNRPVSTAGIADDGAWQLDLPDVDTGIYTLRVDELDIDGNVQSRIETPFKREEAADVAAILAEETSADGFDIAVKTVQPGATLWAIAEERFGSGIMYVAVFEANRDLIRDPDLIYPGQVFRLPEAVE